MSRKITKLEEFDKRQAIYFEDALAFNSNL